MTDAKFYAAIAQQVAWLKVNRLECIVRHRRFKPEIIIKTRRPKKSRLNGEPR